MKSSFKNYEAPTAVRVWMQLEAPIAASGKTSGWGYAPSPKSGM